LLATDLRKVVYFQIYTQQEVLLRIVFEVLLSKELDRLSWIRDRVRKKKM